VDEDGDDDDDDDDEWEDEEEDGDEDEDAPQLLRAAGDPQQGPSKAEPVVDEDGFTLVQRGRR